jgi:hypothetical protein
MFAKVSLHLLNSNITKQRQQEYITLHYHIMTKIKSLRFKITNHVKLSEEAENFQLHWQLH